MDEQRRFTGRQVTIIVVALAVAAIGAPAGVMAATGTSVRLVDRTNPHHAAAVSKAGALSVAVTGHPGVTNVLPAGSFSFSTSDGNKLILKTACKTTFAITSFAVETGSSASSAGLNLVTVGTHANSATGDILSLIPGANELRQLTFPQPFVLKPARAAAGSTCKSEELFEDGGSDAHVTVAGYRLH
jgi:hypothetical protein